MTAGGAALAKAAPMLCGNCGAATHRLYAEGADGDPDRPIAVLVECVGCGNVSRIGTPRRPTLLVDGLDDGQICSGWSAAAVAEARARK